jgi:hypothetical protein
MLVREFQRHYERYSARAVSSLDYLEWLATMQHHGAPTRLLDWTWSEYVALFFAISDAGAHPTDNRAKQCAVWAVNQTQCKQAFASALEEFASRLPDEERSTVLNLLHDDKDPEALRIVLSRDWPGEGPTIATLNPFRVDERRHMQQSTFLVPLATNESFKKNFERTLPGHHEKISITLNPKIVHDILLDLRRSGITALTLFPGVEGLARSAWDVAFFPELRPKRYGL